MRRAAQRGDILGDDGDPVVTERPVVRIGIDRAAVPDDADAARSARAVARIVDVDAKAYVAAVQGAGERAFVEAITLRQTLPTTPAIVTRVERVTGPPSSRTPFPWRPRPTSRGRCWAAWARRPRRSSRSPRGGCVPGDVVGLSGLQASHDDTLSGTAGYVVEAVALDSRATRTVTEVEAKDGTPLRTTLSSRHQLAAEDTLRSVRPASALVAIRPSDGHVLAAASGPGGKGYSTATLGQYAPGSTFKAVTALALLRAGVDQDTRVECTATRVVDGRSFKNYDNYPASRLGRIPFRTAFANSCNTALMAEAGRLERDGLPEAAAALGLTADPALGVPAALGSVPAAAPGVDTAASMIGQGKVLSTPVGMATVAASIAKGAAVSPVLVLGDAPRPPVEAAKPLQRAEAAQLRDLMRAVVTEGSASRLATVPGPPVLAKTGTAEYGADDPPRTHAWMIGVQGDLAVAVFVEDGPGGSSTAGPLLEEFLTRLAELTARHQRWATSMTTRLVGAVGEREDAERQSRPDAEPEAGVALEAAVPPHLAERRPARDRRRPRTGCAACRSGCRRRCGPGR